MAGQRVRPTKAARRHFGMTFSTETRWVLGCAVTLVVACSGSSENVFEGAPPHVFSNAGAGSSTGGSAHAGAVGSQGGSGPTTGGSGVGGSSGGTTGGTAGRGGSSGEAPSTGGSSGEAPGDGGTGASGGSTGGDGTAGGMGGSGVGGSSGVPGAGAGGAGGIGGQGTGATAGEPGGRGGTAGLAGTGGRNGRGGRGSGGRGGTASTGDCDALLTTMNDALTQAQECSLSDDYQCANVVSTACGCLVSVANTESPATHAYLDALDALGDCPVDCTDVICPTPAVTGYCESGGSSAHAHCKTISL